jgi:hypothetical protein
LLVTCATSPAASDGRDTANAGAAPDTSAPTGPATQPTAQPVEEGTVSPPAKFGPDSTEITGYHAPVGGSADRRVRNARRRAVATGDS